MRNGQGTSANHAVDRKVAIVCQNLTGGIRFVATEAKSPNGDGAAELFLALPAMSMLHLFGERRPPPKTVLYSAEPAVTSSMYLKLIRKLSERIDIHQGANPRTWG